MTFNYSYHFSGRPGSRTGARRTAFSLVELLTVIFIISLLIGILIPSINSARNAAKKATTSKVLTSVRVGMEMFKNDNEADFRLTNGYPPSFAHPPIPGYAGNDVLYEGRFPFPRGDADTRPVVYGAHWLPAILMGVDNLGYVKRSSVPKNDNLHQRPWLWYELDPNASVLYVQQRQPLYLDPGGTPTKATKDLPGRQPEEGKFFPDWEEMKALPVIVDAFDQPILYYVADRHGKVTNMVGDGRNENREYTGGPQEEGMPFYFHEDNEGFTGIRTKAEVAGEDKENPGILGWNFGTRQRPHAIAYSGADLTPLELIDPKFRESFARYIVDRKLYQSIGQDTSPNVPLRPVKADSYLLISAGPDGLYGTNDDVTNMPPWPD